MVDFRGFKHSDVPEGARGGVNKHRGVQKSKNVFIALRAGPAAARGCPWLPVYRPCCGSFFFYSLNIPKMVDFRGFKHPDLPEGGRGGGNKHRGVQKSTHRGWGPLTLRESRLLPPLTRLGFYSLNIPQKVDFRGFKHSPVAERGKGGGNKHRGVKKSHKKHFSHRRAYLKRVTATPAVDPPWRPFFLQPQKVVLNTQGEALPSLPRFQRFAPLSRLRRYYFYSLKAGV
ncbi:hypothetical protein ACOMHN_057000 [Nucella lapillus]